MFFINHYYSNLHSISDPRVLTCKNGFANFALTERITYAL